MNKTQAIKQARKEVGELYKLGGGWVFNWYVPDLKAWRTPYSQTYEMARYKRSEKLLEKTLKNMNSENIDSICQCFCAHGGRWTSYL